MDFKGIGSEKRMKRERKPCGSNKGVFILSAVGGDGSRCVHGGLGARSSS